MFRLRKTRNPLGFQISAIILLLVVFVGLGIYFNLVLHTNILYTHFVYIPIILASMWWGRKGILVGALLAGVVLSFHLFGVGIAQLWNDLVRMLFFVLIAFLISLLRDRVMAGQKALFVSEKKYRLLIDRSLTGIAVSKDEKVLFANSRFGEMMGYEPQDIVGMSLRQMVHREDWSRVRQYTAKLKGKKVSNVRYECRFIGKDKRTVWVDIASSLTEYEGEEAVLVNVYDITERKEAFEKQRTLVELARKQEEQLVHSTRLAELGGMAAGISHELNQPLTGIRNYAKNAFYMIENGVGTTQEIKDNLRLISEQVDRASRIINQMRELTRRSERNFTLLDLNSIVRESIEFLMPQLKLSGVKTAVDPDARLPMVMGDRIRLEQVFLNLITNARHAMEESGERLLLIKTCYDAGSDYPVVVELKDTGKGFPKESSEKIFAPFFTTKKTGSGTGLGLSISLSIIKDHGGIIKAESEPGKGALFTVRLPAPQEQGRENVSEAVMRNDEITQSR